MRRDSKDAANDFLALTEQMQALHKAQRLLLETQTEIHTKQIQLVKDQQRLVEEWNQLTMQRLTLHMDVATTSHSETPFEND